MIRIAMVEDLPMILEGLKLLISRVPDFEIVAEYRNGKEFIDRIEHLNADIILTDIDMPEMDGITATQLALAYNPELKIIALTLYSDRKFYYKMVTAGAKGFVLKQAPPDELEQAIREVHAGGNHFSPELLRTVLVEMQGIEQELIKEKKEMLKLSDREVQLLQLICQGLNNKEIAEKTFVSVRTVETTKTRLMQKTKTKNNAGLIIWAIKNKIVSI